MAIISVGCDTCGVATVVDTEKDLKRDRRIKTHLQRSVRCSVCGAVIYREAVIDGQTVVTCPADKIPAGKIVKGAADGNLSLADAPQE